MDSILESVLSISDLVCVPLVGNISIQLVFFALLILGASVVSTNALNRVIVVSASKNSYTTANL